MTQAITWKTEKWAVSKLKEWPNNPRRFTDKGMQDLKNSLERIGYVDPIAINTDGTIIGGHARKKALKSLGIKEVEVRVPSVTLTEEQIKEAVIRLNKNIAGEWNFGDLANHFNSDDLIDWGFTAEELGFSEPVKEGLTDPDEVPTAPETPVTMAGDIWILGNHRLMCGDSTSIEAVERLMDGQKADMVFTDPPYNTGMTKKTNRGSTRLSHMFNDSFSDDEWESLLSGLSATAYSALKDNTAAYFCLDWRRNHELQEHLRKCFTISNVIVWDKVVHGLGSDYKYTYELINVCKKGKPELDTHQGDREYSDVWHIQRKIGRDEDHATKKPVEIIERCLRHASKPNMSCLDLFGGSGSTLIACEKLNRVNYSMELDPRYCDVIIKRWQDFTGQEATHAETGETFNHRVSLLAR